MKRIILSLVGLSFLAMPITGVQAAPVFVPPANSAQVQQIDWKRSDVRNDRRQVEKRRVTEREIVRKKVVTKRWVKGRQVPAWQRKQALNDYRRYGLHRPAHGQQWVRVDNDFLLVGIASGIIAGIVAGR